MRSRPGNTAYIVVRGRQKKKLKVFKSLEQAELEYTVNFKRTRSLVDLERVMLNARDGNALLRSNI